MLEAERVDTVRKQRKVGWCAVQEVRWWRAPSGISAASTNPHVLLLLLHSLILMQVQNTIAILAAANSAGCVMTGRACASKPCSAAATQAVTL